MFGKTGVFCDGLMFGMVTDNTLYFRVDDDNRAAFAEAASFPPLNYEKKGSTIDLSFWRAPERLFDEPDELVTWARIALAAARRVAVTRERTAPREHPSPRKRTIVAPVQAERENRRQSSSKDRPEPMAMTFGIHNSSCSMAPIRPRPSRRRRRRRRGRKIAA
jgi:DNA transformation protein